MGTTPSGPGAQPADLLEAVIGAAADLYFRLSRDGTILDYRAFDRSQLYVPPERFLGRAMQMVLPETASHSFRRAIAAISRGEEHASISYELQVPAGLRSYEARLSAVGNDIVVVVVDTTDREHARALREATTLTAQRILDGAPIGIMIGHPDGRIVDANDAWARALGYSRQEIVSGGVNWQQMTVPEHRDRDRRALAAYRDRHAHPVFEKDVYRKDGSRITILVGTAKIGGDDELGVSFLVDVTEQRRLERAMGEAQRFEGLAMLAGGIAHDFNNILVGILGNASMLLEDLTNGDPACESVSAIHASALRAAELTRQMLAYTGGGSLERDALDLSELVRDVEQLLRSSVGAKAVLDFELAEPGPVVAGDRTQLFQVVMNFVTNASDALVDGSGTIRLRTGVERVEAGTGEGQAFPESGGEGTYGFVEVADDGEGMDGPTRERAFEPFFTTRATGHGLGLAAVRGIVRSHGGVLELWSEPGEGTRIRMLLPLATGAPGQRESRRPERTAVGERLPGSARSWWTTKKRCVSSSAPVSGVMARKCR